MAVISKVNPNFPAPGIDQSSKGFRDNFTIIKTEIEALQGKTIQLAGAITSTPVMLDSGTSGITINTTSKLYIDSFVTGDLSGGILTVTHALGQQIVMVQVSDGSNRVVVPDLVTLTNTTSCSVDLSSYVPLVGTWNVIVRG
jgi:hypothetical protein